MVFKVNTDGTGYTVLKHFTGSDGRNPEAGLTLSGSTLYSTTYLGGTNGTNGGSLGYGTVFKVNTDGTGYTVLKHFTGSDGRNPYAGLTLSGRTLYGTTESGGSSDNGTVFKMNTDGTGYTVLKHFTGNDGKWPDAGLALSGSTLYGTTYAGGTDDGSVGYGTVFALIFAPSSNLSVQPNGVNSVKVLWPDTSSFTLQQNTDLANTNGWATSGDSITTANGTNSITITPVTGNLFFRLKQ
jgi:uncharacterized repeat protein (TIGR03803 family)